MPRRTRFFYETFAARASATFSYHPLDMEAFYRFVWAAQLGRTKYGARDLQSQLLLDGFSAEDADVLSDLYQTCRTFADCRFAPSYVDWKRERGHVRTIAGA